MKAAPALILAMVVATVVLSACSRQPHVKVDAESHLQDTLAGKWLTTFRLRYESGASPIKKQIAAELRANGTLLDKYSSEENGNVVLTLVWSYRGTTIREQYFKGGIWAGPQVYPPQEYYLGELPVWFTLELGQGVPYSELLPGNDQILKEPREMEHTATIESRADNARLFLFGHGARCTRISLF
jgi:hypothetical protein